MRALFLILFLGLFVVACSSSKDEQQPEPDDPANTEETGTNGENPKKTNLLAESERSQLYFDLDQYIGRYQAARDEGNARAWMSLHASVLLPMVSRHQDELIRTVGSDAEPRYRVIATRALGFGDDREAIVPALVDLLGSENPNLVNSALISIYHLGWARTPLPPMIQLLNHEDTLVRSSAGLALYAVFRARQKEDEGVRITGEVKEASGRLVAIAHRPEEDPFVRGHAAAALGAIGDPAAADVLANLLLDQFMFVRIRAAQGLGGLGQEAAILPLINALKVSESTNESKIITASIESIAKDLNYPCEREVLGTDETNWRSWYEAVTSDRRR